MTAPSVEVALGVIEGKVVIRWREPLDEITFDPGNAYKVGLAMCQHAMAAHSGSSAPSDLEAVDGELRHVKMVVTDALRDALVATVASIIGSMMVQKHSPGRIAMHAVDAVLKETAR